MAPVAQPPNLNGGDDLSSARFTSWLEKYGEEEYSIFKNDDTTSAMSYEEWTKSPHVLGPYLMHVTMDIWDEPSSSEDEASEVEAVDVASRTQRVSLRPKNVTTNGHGMRQTAKPSKPTLRQNPDEAPGSAKRKRKSKKHSLSEEIVKSDDSDVHEEAPASGRRKSGGRKKKQFLSEATIAPEDLDDDATSNDAVAATTAGITPADSTKSTAPEYGTSVFTTKAKTPKTKSVKKPKKKSLPRETVPQDRDDTSASKQLGTPNKTVTSPNNQTTSSASRRGLRTRTAAQQNPYQHHAKLFEDQLSEQKSDESSVEPPPKKQTIKFVRSSKINVIEDNNEDETLVADEDEVLAEQSDDLLPNSGKAYYKGKGRAWRKTEEDEDEEFVTKTKIQTQKQPKRMTGRRKSQTGIHEPDEGEGQEPTQPSQEKVQNASATMPSPSTKPPRKKPGPKPGFKRAQAAAAKLQKDQGKAGQASQPAQGKKTTKPKKEKAQDSSVTSPSSSKKQGKQKSGPRKSQTLFLSEEFIVDSSDAETDEQQAAEGAQEPERQSTPPKVSKPRGRPRRSDQSMLSKETVDSEDDADSVGSPPRISTPVAVTSENIARIPPFEVVSEAPQPSVETEEVKDEEKEQPETMEIENQEPRLEEPQTTGS